MHLFLALTLLTTTAPARTKPARPYDAFITAAVQETASVYPVPENLVRAVIHQESGFRPDAVSPVGAIGLMQVMPFNAARLGFTVEDLRDPQKNIRAGARLLAVLLRHYKGDVISALVGYNARPRELGARIPRNGQTPGYVKNVLHYYERYEREDGRTLATKHPRKPAATAPAPALRPSQSLTGRQP